MPPFGKVTIAGFPRPRRLSAGTVEQIATAKALGERLITAAAEQVAGQVREAAGEAADRMGIAVASELRAASEAAKTASAAHDGAWLAVTLAVAALIAATIAAISPLIDARRAPTECSPAAVRTRPAETFKNSSNSLRH